MNHAGITHVGINSGLLPLNCFYKVTARKQYGFNGAFNVNGVLIYFMSKIFYIYSSIYDPSFKQSFSLEGYIGVLCTNILKTKGMIRQSESLLYRATGGMAHKEIVLFKTTAFILASFSSAYALVSKIRTRGRFRLLIRGHANGIENVKFLVRATLRQSMSYFIPVKAIKSIKTKVSFAVNGFTTVVGNIGFKITGFLLSYNLAKVFSVKSFLSTINYIASVPNKYQNLKTDKRWYR